MNNNDCRHVMKSVPTAINVGCMKEYMDYTPRTFKEIYEKVINNTYMLDMIKNPINVKYYNSSGLILDNINSGDIVINSGNNEVKLYNGKELLPLIYSNYNILTIDEIKYLWDTIKTIDNTNIIYSITKRKSNIKDELYIVVKKYNYDENKCIDIILPNFHYSHLFTDLILDKSYTLEELGINTENISKYRNLLNNRKDKSCF